MKITVSGKQMTVRPSLKELTEKKLAKFDRFYAALVRNNGNLTFSDLTALLLNLDKETEEIILGSPDRSLEYRLAQSKYLRTQL